MKVLEKIKEFIKSHIVLTILLGIAVFLDIFLVCFTVATKDISSVHLECVNLKKNESLIALDSSARNGVIKETGFANFGFSNAQKDLFEKMYGECGTVALTVRVQVCPTTKQMNAMQAVSDLPFQFGFLSSEDFNKRGKFIQQIYPSVKRILVQGNLQKAPKTFDVSFAIQKNDDIKKFIPEGFFIYSTVRTKILAACVVPSQMGFDFSEIPFYGYGPNGGKIDFENKAFDFAGGALVFPVQNTAKTVMPEFVITLEEDVAFKSALYDSVVSDVNIGGEKLFVKNVIQANELIVPSGALKTPFSRLEIVRNQECIKSIILRSVKVEKNEGVRTDPGLILKYKPNNWRNVDFEVFEWDRNPGILFFDTRNFAVQEKIFSRLAFFVEKEGYKGTLLTNEELEGKHGYNAHDYSAESMAKFFNKALAQGFILNEEEELLKQILIVNGLFELGEDGETVIAKEGGIVSISQESPEWSRRNLLAHEGWHTIFFRDEEFRNFVSAVYYTMDQKTLDFLIDYFRSQPTLGYDTSDEYLMHNEMMAYIMENPYSKVAENWVKKATWASVMKYTPDLASYIRRTGASGFEDAATALNDYVFDKYGIVCGNISLVTR